MKISVRVKPNMKEEKVEKEGGIFTVYVKEPAKEGRANKAVVDLLSKYFKIPKSRIVILSGMKSKQKIIEIKDYMHDFTTLMKNRKGLLFSDTVMLNSFQHLIKSVLNLVLEQRP